MESGALSMLGQAQSEDDKPDQIVILSHRLALFFVVLSYCHRITAVCELGWGWRLRSIAYHYPCPPPVMELAVNEHNITISQTHTFSCKKYGRHESRIAVEANLDGGGAGRRVVHQTNVLKLFLMPLLLAFFSISMKHCSCCGE